ncbi:MAG TPA: glycosyltransferase, partial [Blastocatellia bacterium]|nr:glycosyltransferase [Blastocatellia bacterium]
AHLEALRRRGAEYLLLPSTAFWWLDFYKDFQRHLDSACQRIWADDNCLIYQLSLASVKAAGAANEAAAAEPLAAQAPEQTPGETPLAAEAALRFSAPDCYDVICFPVIDWDFRFQRPQQLLTQFARDGHRVFYLRTTFHQSGDAVRARRIGENVYEIELPGPHSLNLYRDAIDRHTLAELARALDEFRHRARITEAVAVVDLPFWSPLALATRQQWGWKIIYDCMDEHNGFSTNNSDMLQHEEALLANSDLVLASSEVLHEKCAKVSRQTLRLANATDFDHFNRPGAWRPLEGLSGPIIGYYGAISEWFDVEMIRSAAQTRPGWQFVLIGHTFGANVAELAKLNNVHLLGEKPYAELPNYLREFDVACIPFLRTPLIQATNPVKFYEYLSAGKPVIATELPELAPYKDYYYAAQTSEEFVAQVERALCEDSRKRAQARIKLAKQHTWSARYRQLAAEIPKLYGKAAIIIVSYMQFDYLKLCLESIWAKTSYPNFEVIVVDNGGRPEIVSYLQECAAREPRLKIILNSKNLGFARANNIGIRAAEGCDYVVLLNDDTVVTRGWLGKLIQYLSDSQVGLVGPVTNWTGNEARIAVDYDRIEAMDDFAEGYMRRHAGQSFDVPMLAMYCVGFRRALVDKIGLLDEQFGMGMFEDDDFAMRVRQARHRVICAEDIFIHHWGSASFSCLDRRKYDRLFKQNRKKFEKKWGRAWQSHQYRQQPGQRLQVG